jgi:putative membrane protein
MRSSPLIFWSLLTLYILARILQVYPFGLPMLAIVALHVLPPAIFALIHGARTYGWRGILTFTALAIVIGNVLENVGVLTGFPYGRYYFTGVMGPKIFVVPIFLGLAYIGMAYLSWTVARIILGRVTPALPFLAAAIMVAWDLCQDPVWSTILHAWIFPQGGSYFGVPLSNFFGWYLTVFLIYQSFALYLRRRPPHRQPEPPTHWRQALLFYSVSAAGNLLLVVPRPDIPAIVSAAGVQYRVADITGTCALVTIFTMGVFALLGWILLTTAPGRA